MINAMTKEVTSTAPAIFNWRRVLAERRIPLRTRGRLQASYALTCRNRQCQLQEASICVTRFSRDLMSTRYVPLKLTEIVDTWVFC